MQEVQVPSPVSPPAADTAPGQAQGPQIQAKHLGWCWFSLENSLKNEWNKGTLLKGNAGQQSHTFNKMYENGPKNSKTKCTWK